jgi:hypothetical protein
LYLVEYGRTRLRGVKARKGSELGRDIKPLPGRAAAKIREEDTLDWKWMFKLGRNWRTGQHLIWSLLHIFTLTCGSGRCTVEELNETQTQHSTSDYGMFDSGFFLLTMLITYSRIKGWSDTHLASR